MAATRRSDTRIELLRIVGALSVFAYHFMHDVDSVIGGGFDTSTLWVALREYSGPFGVALFIIISGLVFTWAWPRTSGVREFVRKRLAALFPLYWWIGVPLIIAALAMGKMHLSELWKVPFWLTGLGILSPQTFSPVIAGWWYMTLALQLVLAYPVLRRLQARIGNESFIITSALVTVGSVILINAIGMGWAYRGFIGCRLLEFAAGMTMGQCFATGERAQIPSRTVVSITLAIAVVTTYLGPTFYGPALAIVLVLLVTGLIGNWSGRTAELIGAGGALTFAFYLSHSMWAKPVLRALSPVRPDALRAGLAAVVSLGLATAVAWIFQTSFAYARARVRMRASAK